MDISLSNAIIAETAQQRDLPVLMETAQKVVRPLLGGENVSVGETLVGDLQKLLAQLKSEQEEKKLQLAKQRLSSVLDQLCAMQNLSDIQHGAVLDIQVEIKALEDAIERETTTVEERKKALEKKRLLEAQAQDELKAAEESGDEAAIAEAQAKVASARAESSALEKEIGDLEALIADDKKKIEGCSAKLTDLLAKLDYPALVMVLAAITISASEAEPLEEKSKDGEEKDIPTPLEVVRDSLEKAVEDIREEIVEKRIATV